MTERVATHQGRTSRPGPITISRLNRDGGFMARNNNTYAKRQRDLQKKQKMEDKKARRLKRKETAKSAGDSSDGDRLAGDP
jgi:sRNA-binding protein